MDIGPYPLVWTECWSGAEWSRASDKAIKRCCWSVMQDLVGFASHTYGPVQWRGYQPTSAAKRVPLPSVMLRHVMLRSVTSHKVTSRYVTLRYVTSCYVVMSRYILSRASCQPWISTTKGAGLIESHSKTVAPDWWHLCHGSGSSLLWRPRFDSRSVHGICRGQCATETGFSPSTLIFPWQYIPPMPHSSILEVDRIIK